MKQDKLNELISAYLDGESEDPEAVERLIEGDLDVRRRFEALKSQSETVRSLPPPEVRPEFSTRVLAAIRAEERAAPAGWWRFAAPLAAAAVVVLVLGGVYVATRPRPEGPQPPPVARQDGEPRVEDLEEAAVHGLARNPDVLAELETTYEADAEDPWDVAAAETLDEMAEVLNEDAELDALIDELSDGEKAVLRELLIEYATEG